MSSTDQAQRAEQDRIAADYQAGTDRGRQGRDGVVVTPVEIVDFIVRATLDSLYASHGVGLTDPRVKITDPFGGTGIFLARLYQLSGLTGMELDDLVQRTEMLELDEAAAWIAKANLRKVVADLGGTAVPPIYQTDTFTVTDTPDPATEVAA